MTDAVTDLICEKLALEREVARLRAALDAALADAARWRAAAEGGDGRPDPPDL